MDEETRQNRLRVAWVGVFVLGLVAAGLMLPRFMDDEGEVPAVAAVPTAVETPTPSPIVTATPTAMPESTPTPSVTATPTSTPVPTLTPTPTPTVGPAETVLFRGGPAQGPWQQLGTVAEITHPDAPPSARYSYTNFWADPEEENQPDELWDQLVKEVTAQLVELGEPVDRPAFGGAEGSEPFNSFGGMEDIYRSEEIFTAYWNGEFEDGEGVGSAYFHFVIDFNADVVARRLPIIFREDGVRTFEDNIEDHLESLRAWASERGYSECDKC